MPVILKTILKISLVKSLFKIFIKKQITNNIKITFVTILLLVIILASHIGCTKVKEYPEDLIVKFYWDTGTLPPEYYYYYRIIIGPGLQGLFEYQPGYGEPPAPDVWRVNFTVSKDQLGYLYQLLVENNLFKDKWETTEMAVGGSVSSIAITANGREYKIPSNAELKKEDSIKIDIVSDYLRGIVPTYIWEEMEKRQNQFEESFFNKVH